MFDMNIEEIKKKYPEVSICPMGNFKGSFRTSEINNSVEHFEMFTKNGITLFRFFKEYWGEKIYTEPEAFLMGSFNKNGDFLLFPPWVDLLRQFHIPETIISTIREKFEIDMDAPTRVYSDDIAETLDDAGIRFQIKKIKRWESFGTNYDRTY